MSLNWNNINQTALPNREDAQRNDFVPYQMVPFGLKQITLNQMIPIYKYIGHWNYFEIKNVTIDEINRYSHYYNLHLVPDYPNRRDPEQNKKRPVLYYETCPHCYMHKVEKNGNFYDCSNYFHPQHILITNPDSMFRFSVTLSDYTGRYVFVVKAPDQGIAQLILNTDVYSWRRETDHLDDYNLRNEIQKRVNGRLFDVICRIQIEEVHHQSIPVCSIYDIREKEYRM